MLKHIESNVNRGHMNIRKSIEELMLNLIEEMPKKKRSSFTHIKRRMRKQVVVPRTIWSRDGHAIPVVAIPLSSAGCRAAYTASSSDVDEITTRVPATSGCPALPSTSVGAMSSSSSASYTKLRRTGESAEERLARLDRDAERRFQSRVQKNAAAERHRLHLSTGSLPVTLSSTGVDSTIKVEPPEELVPFEKLIPFQELSVDPLPDIEMEGGCLEGCIKQELQLDSAASFPIKAEPPGVSHGNTAWQHEDAVEPLEEVNLLEESFSDPLTNLKTEGVCREDDTHSGPGCIKQELDPSSPRLVEPRGVSHGAGSWTRRDLECAYPGSTGEEDYKPEEHSDIEGFCHQGSTQPPHGEWDRSIKSELPHPVAIWMEYPNASNPNTAVMDPCMPNFGEVMTRQLRQGTKPEVQNMEEPQVVAECDFTYHEEEVMGCNICQMQFRKKTELEKHIKAHKNEEKLRCKVCSKQFASTSQLTTHTRVHTGEKPYKCDVCSKQFRTSSNLSKHTIVHTNDKPFKCDLCSKQFACTSHLRSHTRIHTGVKPFKCDICSKQFRTSSNLTMHTFVHMNDKPFKCDLCSKQFASISQLTTHTRVHTGEKPYKCDICSKQFRTSSNLNMHTIVHTNDKPFKCDLCSKQFACTSHLRSHTRIHTGVKPYKCDICSKQYPWASSLNCHRKTHTM